MDNDAIQTLVTRLARPHRSGGRVIERAAIMAAGADSTAVLTWINDHDGEPEAARGRNTRGLHAERTPAGGEPLRYVLPPEALA